MSEFVWYELMTTDRAAAQVFYGAVLGWTARDSGMPHMAYDLLAAGDVDIGGVMDIPESAAQRGAPPAWIGYVAVKDVDASAQKAVALGGAVYREPQDIPGVGRFAIIADPQGGVLALFRGLCDTVSSRFVMGTPGHPNWNEYNAPDPQAGFDFYAALFGWTKTQAHDMGPPLGLYQLYAAGDRNLGGMAKALCTPAHAHWTYYFWAGQIDETANRITQAGGTVTHGPVSVPGGAWILHARDPQGAHFAVLGMR